MGSVEGVRRLLSLSLFGARACHGAGEVVLAMSLAEPAAAMNPAVAARACHDVQQRRTGAEPASSGVRARHGQGRHGWGRSCSGGDGKGGRRWLVGSTRQ